MESEGKKKEKLINKLRYKYRLVIINDGTFKEEFSVKLSRLNVFSIIGTLMILFVFIVYSVIAYTPIREFIPGYTNEHRTKQVFINAQKLDSLEKSNYAKKIYLENQKRIFMGDINASNGSEKPHIDTVLISDNIDLSLSETEMKWRNSKETEDVFNFDLKNDISSLKEASSIVFFVPLRGPITNTFRRGKHDGVDIVSNKNNIINSTLDGTVIQANWTFETGNVISVQHKNNFISVYKHNSKLLKKQGDFVRAGEGIAIVGGSGELSTGPHLHFELWHDGIPVNPVNYIVF